MTETIRSADGTTIAYDAYGDGPPVILVGGLFQHRALDERTAELARRLGERFTAYHYDRRGRGDSTDTPPWAVRREVEDLAALVERAGGETMAFGMSSGGALALEAAAAGVPLTRIAVYEPPFGGGENTEASADKLRALTDAGRNGDAVALFLSATGLPEEAIADFRRAPVFPLFEAVAPTMAYDTTMMADPALLAERIPRVEVPVLVMDGGDSPPWGAESAELVAAAAPNARRRTLPGQTHEVSTDALAPVLLEFFGEAG